jgi:hypothetical protein
MPFGAWPGWLTSRGRATRRIDHRHVIAATLRPPPRKYGVTLWSSRLLATYLNIGDATVAGAGREYGVQPWRPESFRFSTDPLLKAKGRRRRRASPALVIR